MTATANHLRTVSVLCTGLRSFYHGMPAVEPFDPRRDCRTFSGGMPVVCHPPCRAWSKFLRHQAKPEPGEKELGILCAGWLRECGGVLEHPAHSLLFESASLPLPGESIRGLWTVEVPGAWWGDPRTKKTWLCFSRIPRRAVTFPFTLRHSTDDDAIWRNMSKRQRSLTPEPMAAWLVDAARLAQ